MKSIKTKVICLDNEVTFNCEDNTLLEEYYRYIFNIIMGNNYNEDGETLSRAFTFIKKGKKQKGRYDYEIIEFFNNFGYDMNNIILDFNDGYGMGAGAEILEFIRIRVNPNENKHNYAPHVHISRANTWKPSYRIHLETLQQMKGDEPKWEKQFNNSERRTILELLTKNRDVLIDYYNRVVKGEYITETITIEHNGKQYLIK